MQIMGEQGEQTAIATSFKRGWTCRTFAEKGGVIRVGAMFGAAVVAVGGVPLGLVGRTSAAVGTLRAAARWRIKER